MTNNKFEHRGYTGIYSYDLANHSYYGRIAGINGMMGFYGQTLKEAEGSFRSAVNTYIEFMEECDKRD